MLILEAMSVNTIILFLLLIPEKSVAVAPSGGMGILSAVWFWISVCEFPIIILLALKLRSKKPDLALADLNRDTLKKAKGSAIDMTNLMDSIYGSKELYKELSRRCHPDRFVNTSYQPAAEEIFQEISESQRDFEKLSALKVRAANELNINFKA
jgi:hypothetical protein